MSRISSQEISDCSTENGHFSGRLQENTLYEIVKKGFFCLSFKQNLPFWRRIFKQIPVTVFRAKKGVGYRKILEKLLVSYLRMLQNGT